MARLREAEQYVVTNRADAVGRLASPVAGYCPVETLMRPVVPDFKVTWERKRA